MDGGARFRLRPGNIHHVVALTPWSASPDPRSGRPAGPRHAARRSVARCPCPRGSRGSGRLAGRALGRSALLVAGQGESGGGGLRGAALTLTVASALAGGSLGAARLSVELRADG